MSNLIPLLQQMEALIVEPLYDEKYSKTHWPYYPYSIKRFLNHLKEAKVIFSRKKNLKFIDVGCGIGTKVHLAQQFFDSYGVELNQSYADIAKEINRPKKFDPHGTWEKLTGPQRIFQKDALDFDYTNYDIIYFFRPMKGKPQHQLEKRIFMQAKEGAIIIPIYALTEFPDYIHKLQTPSQQLHIKTTDSEKAEEIKSYIKHLFKARSKKNEEKKKQRSSLVQRNDNQCSE
jgi:SAM-dependent methyltransferase